MSKPEFVELAKLIEIHIQSNKNYKACIGMGHFTRTLALGEMLKDEFYCIYSMAPSELYILTGWA